MSMDRLSAQLEELAGASLLRRRVILEGPQGPRVTVEGLEYLAFCSNDYLGLANDPRIGAAVVEAVQRHGVGAGASHLVTGHNVEHECLEEELARFVGMPRSLFFSSGYLANLGVITALAERGDAVFSDALNHASLIDGMRLSRAQIVKIAHCDVEALDRALGASSARAKFVVTEGVFSMDGDVAPLPQMLESCERHGAWLIVDDAHGFGVLGANGKGVLEHFGVNSPRIVYVGTLGKAAGVSGAFVAGAAPVVETILQRARSYIYTTASPAFLASAVRRSLEIVGQESWRRRKLAALIAVLKGSLRASGLTPCASQTAIQPFIIGGNAETIAASSELRKQGIIVTAIRPPTVPQATARLRISLSATHEEADVRKLGAALGQVAGSGFAWQRSLSPARTPA
jgi:8-amino-7-oxononanoate synthase